MNVAKGTGERMFAPEDYVTREQMSAFITNFVNIELDNYKKHKLGFTDVTSNSIFRNSIDFVYTNGIMVGKDKDGKIFDPNENINRQEITAVCSKINERI
jgi:hypothetical protein